MYFIMQNSRSLKEAFDYNFLKPYFKHSYLLIVNRNIVFEKPPWGKSIKHVRMYVCQSIKLYEIKIIFLLDRSITEVC